MTSEADFGGAGSPRPHLVLLRPVGYQGFVQTVVSLALIVPLATVVFHIGLLSAPVLTTGADFLSFGVPS